MVIEFDRNEKRIVVSHTRIWEQGKVEEAEAAKKEARVDADKTKKAVKNIQTKVEKSTLGDLGVLAELKKKMEGDSKEEATPPVELKKKMEEDSKKEVTPPAELKKKMDDDSKKEITPPAELKKKMDSDSKEEATPPAGPEEETKPE
jgi:hypothetical protein